MNAEPARPLPINNDLHPDELRDMTPEERQELVAWLEHMKTLEPDPNEPTLRDIFEEMNRHRSPDNQIPLPDGEC